jgi:hypothetical protein
MHCLSIYIPVMLGCLSADLSSTVYYIIMFVYSEYAVIFLLLYLLSYIIFGSFTERLLFGVLHKICPCLFVSYYGYDAVIINSYFL